ncbi:MAG TPA: PEP-CTERM sorting domain-containing protein [Terriglobales bacterium]|nr:PEP-CTERM sorting domain-containing protein [Terriglobales bacterium]
MKIIPSIAMSLLGTSLLLDARHIIGKHFCALVLGFGTLSLGTNAASAEPIVSVITSSLQLGQMDLATGSFSPVGSIPSAIQFLIPGPTGSLLTMSFDGNLSSVNPATGVISVIGPTGFSDCSTPLSPTCGPNSQLSFGAAGGAFYATDFSNNLYTVDPATGHATLIGATGIPGIPFIPLSTNPDGSLNIYDENLFSIGENLYANFDAASLDFSTFTFTIAISPSLYSIDVGTGRATEIASTDFGLSTILSLNGAVYGFSGLTNQVVTLDLNNGSTSFVSDIDPSAGLVLGAAAEEVPEPSTVGLSAFGLLGIVVWWRRTRARVRGVRTQLAHQPIWGL